MRYRFGLLTGLLLHAPLALAGGEQGRAPDPGLLEFLGTFDSRDQGADWFEFLEGMRAARPPAGAAAKPHAPADDADEPKTGT
jgi:hypothetical protein